MASLSSRQVQELRDALVSAFDLGELKQVVFFSLGETLQNVTLGGDLLERAFDLIQWAERRGRTPELIQGAVRENPGNAGLKAFVGAYERSAQNSIGHQELEKIVVQNQTYKDAKRWRDRLDRIVHQVCRIELGPQAKGSGFLVSPRVVLTNYHVVEEVLNGMAHPSKIAVRFDYHLGTKEEVPEHGVVHKLSEEWLIDQSPYDPIDRKPKPKEYEPDLQHLDYAFLRLEKPAGEETVEGEARSFIEFPAGPPSLEVDGPLFIVQHPEGNPMKLALNTQSILEVNAESTRVRHKTNTDGGSSGSPCFDSDWNLIALHHSGDPAKIKPEFNEGIPIATIRGALEPAVRAEVGWT